MLSLPPSVRILLARQPADMRKGFDGLSHLVQSVLREDPLSGHLFVFRNRRGDRVKLLLWDSDGFLIVYKRLEKGTFRFPAPSDADATSVTVNATDLIMLLDGVDLQSVKRRPRYVRDPASIADFSGSPPSRTRACAYNITMNDAEVDLPNDVPLCHELIRQQADSLDKAQRRIEQLEHAMDVLLRQKYGPRSERLDPNQLRLFTDEGDESASARRRGPESPEKPKQPGSVAVGRPSPSTCLACRSSSNSPSKNEPARVVAGFAPISTMRSASSWTTFRPRFSSANSSVASTRVDRARSMWRSRPSRPSRSTKGWPARVSWPT